jgi:hypothetical protein
MADSNNNKNEDVEPCAASEAGVDLAACSSCNFFSPFGPLNNFFAASRSWKHEKHKKHKFGDEFGGKFFQMIGSKGVLYPSLS